MTARVNMEHRPFPRAVDHLDDRWLEAGRHVLMAGVRSRRDLTDALSGEPTLAEGDPIPVEQVPTSSTVVAPASAPSRSEPGAIRPGSAGLSALTVDASDAGPSRT